MPGKSLETQSMMCLQALSALFRQVVGTSLDQVIQEAVKIRRRINSGLCQGRPGRTAGAGAPPVAALGIIGQVASRLPIIQIKREQKVPLKSQGDSEP